MDLATLLPNFGNIAFTLAAFVLALSIIVAVHEYGHYIVGRWSGIHAEVFSIGFGPVLWSRADRRGTVWQIAALPFGGYVKFLGDADAASVTPDGTVPAAEKRRTMHGAPLWARSATVVAGPVFNFIFSIIVFAGYIAWQGIAEDTPRLGALHPLPAPATQLQPGDLILSIDGTPVDTLADFYRVAETLPGAPQHRYLVDRQGNTLDLIGPHPVPARAGSISLQSAARDAGLQPGDVVLTVDGSPVYAFAELPPRVAAAEGAPVALQVWRPDATGGGTRLELELIPRRTDLPRPEGGFETRWLIGLTSSAFFDHPTRSVSLTEVVPLAASQTWDVVARSISGLSHMIAGAISTCNLSGPVGIARTSGAMAQDGLMSFIFFLAVLSTAVGLLNLFPIPVLDGGHLVFHAWEAVTGKPPSERVLGALMTVGIVLLGSLMLFALANDLLC
jgi:regulator of sigma E protease